MRFGEVVLTRVCDVEDMSDAEGLNDMGISCVVPIAQVEPSWEYLVWICL